MVGRFRTAPADKRSVKFAWSGDTGGQGWGIDTDRGGMKTYSVMAKHQPDFFIHSGDTIYADGPFASEQKMPDGGTWKNITDEGTSKVAETIDEFRANWKYNMLDEHVRDFNGQVPVFYQWDDHETLNNWYPGEMLISDDRYTVKSSSLLSARANRAFLEMSPIRTDPKEPGRIYRKVSHGPTLDIFFLDMRTYRGPNSANDQAEASADTAFLGNEQVRWLKQELLSSKATWKVIAADMPIGIMVRDGKEAFENGSNGDGPARGRELEIADLLRFIRDNDVKNTVWLTADVHYTAAHYYDPNQAPFQEFAPFWEFVSGPLHAGTFGPGDMDNTFGPQVKYVKAPTKEQGQNLPPSMGLQFFGLVDIDGESEEMRVSLRDVADEELYTVTIKPERA
jgi:alkaline phosphatase D